MKATSEYTTNFWVMRVRPDDREAIAELAQRMGVSASKAVRIAVRQCLSDTAPNQFVRGAQKATGVLCGVDGCDQPPTGDRAYCKKHQMRFQRTGDPTLARKRGRKPGRL